MLGVNRQFALVTDDKTGRKAMPEVTSIHEEGQNQDWQTNFPLHFPAKQNACSEGWGWIQTHSRLVLPLKFMHGFLHHLQGQIQSGNEQQKKCFSLKDCEATDDDFYRLKVMNPDVFSN